jgi:hypothetical protein
LFDAGIIVDSFLQMFDIQTMQLVNGGEYDEFYVLPKPASKARSKGTIGDGH